MKQSYFQNFSFLFLLSQYINFQQRGSAELIFAKILSTKISIYLSIFFLTEIFRFKLFFNSCLF